MDVEDQLRDVLHRSMRGVDPPVRELVAGAVRDGRSPRRRRLGSWAVGAVAATAVVAATAAVTRPWSDPSADGPAGPPAVTTSPSGTATPAGRCGPAREGLLPPWARTGFSDPEPVIARVMGDEGHIVAILFGRVLHAPPAQGLNNKILWVARTSSMEPLQIDAVRAGDDRLVHREVAGGPGPSIVDLPRAGCWHLSLRWGAQPDQRDTMVLQYVAPE